jgi:hypothetical protein
MTLFNLGKGAFMVTFTNPRLPADFFMKKSGFVLLLTLIASWASATHNLGGDMSYRWISGDTYEITVHTFTDAGAPANRCELIIYFGDGDSAIAPRVNNVTGAGCSLPEGDGVLITPNVRYSIYTVTHTYPGTGIYHLTMTDPNRHANVLNIPNSVNTPFTVEAEIRISPSFSANTSMAPDNYLDLDTAYSGLFHQFNAHGTDATDGDSLVYELIACAGANNYTLPFNNFYFGCDSVTGVVDWCNPSSIGYFSYAVRTVEYRWSNNQYYQAGYTTRDIFAIVYAWNGVEAQALLPAPVIFPNPALSYSDVTIGLKGINGLSNCLLEVVDAHGKKIDAKYTIKGSDVVIEGNSLSPGLYIFELTDQTGKRSAGRLEVIK